MKDTPMQELELPPAVIQDETQVETPNSIETPENQTPSSPLPTANKVRPKSTVSSSTEKVLHFLSGHSNTPKPTASRNTNDKRTRHMSLVSEHDASSPSILQSKFLSSLNHQRKQQQRQQQTLSSPSPNTSASTPHPAKKTQPKRNVRLSTVTPPTPTERGTRRKTLSLLVNSMTDNKMSFNRRQSHARPNEDNTRIEMMPSVSEHTMNTLSDKDKHKSTGKKLMDWFKKKPLSTIQKSSNQPIHDPLMHDRVPSNPSHEPKLRIHHGAVDQEALTSRAPAQVLVEVKQTLKSLGLEYKRDGSEFKLKCVRPKRAIEKRKTQIQPSHLHNNGTPFRMLLRRASASQQTDDKPATIYGDPNADPGEEVRFSVELCKIKNLPGLYIVDMRRMRGNVWAYKFIYRTLLDTLKLGGKSEYLKTTTQKKKTPPSTRDSSNRTSIISSSGGNSSSVLLDDPATTTTKEIAV
ncbi:hypothetical protein CU098_012687 [Rhizopus stolonifer]|uniref:non-specific serine/threonine protein kinase n=2 Tax=Mucorineae TaxID=1344963 RepID=A0A367KPB6_RHIST|nr:hypothetical protein CU098_012687 [Rhizopus stolonifer]